MTSCARDVMQIAEVNVEWKTLQEKLFARFFVPEEHNFSSCQLSSPFVPKQLSRHGCKMAGTALKRLMAEYKRKSCH